MPALLVADLLHDLLGEGEELGGAAHRALRRDEQLAQLVGGESELLGQHMLDHPALFEIEAVIHARGLDEQGGHGYLKIIGALFGGGGGLAGEEVKHAVDHIRPYPCEVSSADWDSHRARQEKRPG